MSGAVALIALVNNEVGARSGEVAILSPAVGMLRGVPTPGHLLSGGEPFATLTILGRSHSLFLPESVSGVVADLAVSGHGADTIPVEYGQTILTLAPLDAASVNAGARPGIASRAAAGAAAASIPAGCHAVLSPADGVFYRRSRPTRPSYVEVGARVKVGQTLALIEAMKCFSAITYGAPGFPEQAEIVEARAEDASEVRHGQVLFVVR